MIFGAEFREFCMNNYGHIQIHNVKSHHFHLTLMLQIGIIVR